MRIRVRCTACGRETDLPPQQILLEVAVPPTAHGRYSFDCPSCGARVQRLADERAIKLLEAGGVEPSATEPHPEQPPGGPPLTADDLIDLHELLARDDWFELAARGVRDSR